MASSRAADIEVVVVPREGAGEGEQSPASNATASPSFVSCDEGSPARWESSSSPSCSSCSSGSGRSSAQENPVRPDGLAEIVHWSPKDDCEGEGDDDDGASVGSEGGAYCRICFDGPRENEPLFRACDCKGSVAYVHHECLSRWVSDSQRAECELCHGRFRIPEGMKSFLPRTAILHKACTVAADSVTRSTALFNLLPQGSGAVTSSSAIVYLRGYGHDRGCEQMGLCQFPTAFPTGVLGEYLTETEWSAAISRINRESLRMINMSWRFVIFIACLVINISLIITLSFVDHAMVIPFMFAVILIQLMPAVLFAWLVNHHNAGVHQRLSAVCAELTDAHAASGITFGFHAITAHDRGGRMWNPYAVHPIGEPKVIKFLTVERGMATLGVSPISSSESENEASA